MITVAGYRFVAVWGLGLLLLFVVGACAGARALGRYKLEAEAERREFVATTAASEATARDEGAEAKVGLYVNRVDQVSLVDSSWTAECDIWFRWSDPRIRPGETFQVVNGEILHRERVEARSSGGEQYERYQVSMKLTKVFDSTRYPFGDELMSIQLEDRGVGVDGVRYVVDEAASGLNPLDSRPQATIAKAIAVVRDRFEPARGASGTRRRSRFIFAVLGSPPGWALYLKMFQALFASVAISLIVFFLKPIHVDPRFGLGVGGAFASIANNIMVAGYFPAANRFTLMSMTNAVGLATIFLTLVESAIALYIFDTLGQPRLRVLLDRVTFVVLLGGYVASNALWVSVAMP